MNADAHRGHPWNWSYSSCEPPRGVGNLAEHDVLIFAEPSLHLPQIIFKMLLRTELRTFPVQEKHFSTEMNSQAKCVIFSWRQCFTKLFRLVSLYMCKLITEA